jgi:sugar lactone lactonase YvrE
LGAAGLIEVRGADELARRSLLKKAVAAAAVGTVALPVVQSIVTPSVAAAQSGDIDPGPDPEPDPDPDPDLDPDPGQLFAGSATTFGGTTQGAANGSLTVAQFNGPRGIAVAPDGTIYIADTTNHRIRAISPGGIVSTLAGGTQGSANGTGTAAQFNNPSGVAVGPNGVIYVADTNNSRIRAITPAGVVTTFAGSSYGTGQGFFASPRGVAVAADGTVYVADTSNHNIVALTPSAAYTPSGGQQHLRLRQRSGACQVQRAAGHRVVSPTVLPSRTPAIEGFGWSPPPAWSPRRRYRWQPITSLDSNNTTPSSSAVRASPWRRPV